MRLACYTAILTAVLLAGVLPRWATAGEAVEVEVAKSISDPGLELLAAGAVVLPLYENGGAGRNETLRTADTLVVTAVACRALKAVVREPRPDGRGNDSFPSNHATLAFAAATISATDLYLPGGTTSTFGRFASGATPAKSFAVSYGRFG